jgi:potassium efflux system protein
MIGGIPRRARLAAGVLALVAALLVAQGSPAQTQGAGQTAGQAPAAQTAPDYAAWDIQGDRAEAAVSNPETSSELLDAIRSEVVARRQEFMAEQNVNSTRIATLREQLSALGEPPAEGQTEAPEIAARRTTLKDQLDQLQVPGLTASEAYRRADGIIREIDRVLRDRQADELMRIWPSPLNPANWAPGIAAVTGSWSTARDEVAEALARPSVRRHLADQLPLIVGLSLAGLGLILRGAYLMERATVWLRTVIAPRWLTVILPVLSFGKILLPVMGLLFLVAAAQHSDIFGPNGLAAIQGLASVGLSTLFANWLGSRMFPKENSAPSPLRLPPERRAEGRIIATLMGLLVGIESFRSGIYVARSGEAAAAVLAFPPLVIAGFLLVRMGNLFRRYLARIEEAGDQPLFRDRMLGLLGQAAIVLGIVGPVLGAIGYIPAALAIVYPAITSLAIVGMIHVLQTLVEDIHGTLTGHPDPERGALVPVLVGFALALASLPVLALVWGARVEDLAELWTAFTRGFSIGETQISPSAFAVLAVVFAIGFTVTRLLQAALRLSILPRTKLDHGGQNAILAGFGYAGIFISGLVAVHAAGINLAGLAIVAGALSLGVGFGLKNIVENFVSGIILLVERPVSEGDWIEVGGLQGTVQAISVRSTRIQTFDRSDVIVPNADLVSGQVTNFTRFNLAGRLIVPVAVAYDSDSRLVERVLREIVEAEPMAMVHPTPQVVLMDFGSGAMNFEVRMILSDVNFSLSVRSEMNHEIVRRFREEGIEIPFAQSEVWVHDGGGDVPVPAARAFRPRPPRRVLVRDEATTNSGISDSDGDGTDR